jgi:hypothetical protein
MGFPGRKEAPEGLGYAKAPEITALNNLRIQPSATDFFVFRY